MCRTSLNTYIHIYMLNFKYNIFKIMLNFNSCLKLLVTVAAAVKSNREVYWFESHC